MKKTFQKTLIAAAAGVALMGTASANSLLFPYFTTKTGAQSVLSLSSIDDNKSGSGVHYVYNYGSACTHYDATGTLTANDVLTHSVASTAYGGFGKAVSADTSVPVYLPVADVTGFLVVTAKNGTSVNSISGSMAIVDPSSGLVAAYPGISNGLNTGAAAGAEGDFSIIKDVNFPLSFLPSSLATTSWYGVVAGQMYPNIALGKDWNGTYTITNNGNVYSNDEVAYSGTKTASITCAGSFTPSSLMNDAQANSVSATGGFIAAKGTASTAAQFTVNAANNSITDLNGGTAAVAAAVLSNTGTGVVLVKMQTVQASVGAPFAGKQFLAREVVSVVAP